MALLEGKHLSKHLKDSVFPICELSLILFNHLSIKIVGFYLLSKEFLYTLNINSLLVLNAVVILFLSVNHLVNLTLFSSLIRNSSFWCNGYICKCYGVIILFFFFKTSLGLER